MLGAVLRAALQGVACPDQDGVSCMTWEVLTRALAQAGTSTSKTALRRQWWDRVLEWSADASRKWRAGTTAVGAAPRPEVARRQPPKQLREHKKHLQF